eukprot:COSAG06_NODE_61797_length_266_cov_1.736527_1_plen_43_part_10
MRCSPSWQHVHCVCVLTRGEQSAGGTHQVLETALQVTTMVSPS